MATDWKSIVQTVAPQLATIFGGPLAGMAVSALGSKLLGKSAATLDEVQTAVLNATPADLIKIKEVETELVESLDKAGVDLAQIDAADRASARDREVKVADWTPRVLAMLIILGWLTVQGYLLGHVVDQTMRELIARLLGTLDSALMCVLYYYFGSSASSKGKDATITTMATKVLS